MNLEIQRTKYYLLMWKMIVIFHWKSYIFENANSRRLPDWGAKCVLSPKLGFYAQLVSCPKMVTICDGMVSILSTSSWYHSILHHQEKTKATGRNFDLWFQRIKIQNNKKNTLKVSRINIFSIYTKMFVCILVTPFG